MADRREMAHDRGFVEVADRCWVARYDWFDVNVGVVAGARGLLVVDTNASEAAARTVLDQVRRLGGDVVAVVNTHEHFDHTFGNAVFRAASEKVVLHAHETAADRMVDAGLRIQERYAADPGEPHAADVVASRIVVPEITFSSTRLVDLGDRMVELIHPGRGHTGGDALVRVPDADLMFAGDLVEESGVPGFGADCFPLEWPATLDLMLGVLTARTVVVPGHGLPVDRDFVHTQRDDAGTVAQTIAGLAGGGVPAHEALGAAEWPYPSGKLTHAVQRGYAHLPRDARSLPLA